MDHAINLHKGQKMKLNVIAVFDKKTALYDQPFTIRHNGDAIRQWDIVRTNQETRYGKNPEDFDLFQIGTYDDETGTFENLTPPTHLASGV